MNREISKIKISTVVLVVCSIVIVATIFTSNWGSSSDSKAPSSEVVSRTTLTVVDEVVCDKFASLALKIDKGLIKDDEARQELLKIYDNGGRVASFAIKTANEDMIAYLTSYDNTKSRSYADFIVACNLNK